MTPVETGLGVLVARGLDVGVATGGKIVPPLPAVPPPPPPPPHALIADAITIAPANVPIRFELKSAIEELSSDELIK